MYSIVILGNVLIFITLINFNFSNIKNDKKNTF